LEKNQGEKRKLQEEKVGGNEIEGLIKAFYFFYK
jgi:hypothetical protein